LLKEKKTISESLKESAPYLGLGVQLAATTALLAFIGIFLDNKFNTKPIWILVCTFFGAFAGLYNFIKNILQANKKKKQGQEKK
jgi:F0F1-type ATP synthase assembly protein I